MGSTDIPVCATAATSPPVFRIALSIEKNGTARETLRPRSFYRPFPPGDTPDPYYVLLCGKISPTESPERLRSGNAEWFAPREDAGREAIQAESGAPGETERLSGLIRAAVAPSREE